MFAFFFGFIFLFLDYSVTLGGRTVQLIPAFVGYFLITVGAAHMTKKHPGFRKVRNLSAVLVFWSAVVFLLDIFPPSEHAQYILFAVGLLSTVFALYLTHLFTVAIHKTEGQEGRALNGDKLSSGWALLTMTSVLSYAGLLLESLVFPCLVLQIAGTVWFLSSVLKCATLYRKKEPGHTYDNFQGLTGRHR